MPVTVTTLRKLKQEGKKFSSLTAYDASFSQLLDEAGVEVLLVGDSLGMVVQGQQTTLPVSVDEIIYHTANVCRGSDNALVVSDMPFMSDSSPELALANAGRLMKEGGAQMVKLEGGAVKLDTVSHLTAHAVPVCAHLGLLPQSVHKMGGYRVQGRDEESAMGMVEEALALEQAGADMLVLECVPRDLAGRITESLDIPVIGIGAGPECDGQVLVLYDMLGITPGKRPSFSHDFLADAGTVEGAIKAFVDAVRSGAFPAEEHCF